MKTIFFFLTFFACQVVNPTPIDVRQDNELFLEGNACFLQGRFGKARDCYERISQKSGAVWHNLGNCYFNEKNNVKALVCWKRAEKNASFHQLGQLFASERTVLELLHCPYDGIFISSVKRVIFGVSKITMQMMMLIFLLLFLTIWYRCEIRIKSVERFTTCKKKYLMWLFFGIVTLLLIMIVKEKYQLEKQVVIMKDKSSMYVGPDSTYTEKMILPLGCVARVVDEKNGMVKIVSSFGSGWISCNDVEIV